MGTFSDSLLLSHKARAEIRAHVKGHVFPKDQKGQSPVAVRISSYETDSGEEDVFPETHLLLLY